MFKLNNPLPQALRDTSRLINFYREWNLVPYAGNSSASSHVFLRTLCSMYELSATHGDCIDDLAFWAFEGNFDVIRKEVEGLEDEDGVEVARAEKVEFTRWFRDLGLKNLQDITQHLFKDEKKTGNCWLHYKEVEVGGERRVFLNVIDSQEVMYLKTDEDEPRAVVISPDFFYGDFKSTEPKLIRVYPDFSEPEDGVRETVFHWRNKRDHSDWYGRPDTLHKLFWMFIEWRQAVTMAKVADSEVVAKGLIVAEAHDPKSKLGGSGKSEAVDFEKMAIALRKITTNRGDFEEAESLGVLRYPHGNKEPKLISMDLNRDTAYTELVLRAASDHIYAGHRWSKLLSGYERAKHGIGGNVLFDEYVTRNEGVIVPLQEQWASRWKTVFREMMAFDGAERFDGLGLQFKDKITPLADKLKGSNGDTNIVTGTGGDNIEPDTET